MSTPLTDPAELDDVKKIVGDINMDDADAQCFVDYANQWIEALCLEDAECHTAATVNMVATFVAAHFITMRDRRVEETETDGARDRYESVVGQGLEGSSYGQQAKRFDCSGILGDSDANNQAETGTKPSHIFQVCGR
jgi:hypothetical protein